MIKSLTARNFMGFDVIKQQHFAPINIFLGKNDSGKTSLLKLIYSSLSAIDEYSKRVQHEELLLKKVVAEKLLNTFQPGKKGLGELVNKISKEKLSVDIEFYHDKLKYEDRLHYAFGDSTTNTIVDCQDSIRSINESFKCVFVPAKEVLTALKAIRATRDNLRIPGFDDTYLDLIRALVIPTQQGKIKTELHEVNKKLEALFDGKIEQKDEDDFIFKKGNTEYQMTLTAEGVKKIGILTTLIKNRQLNGNSVLMMDEPETALHPQAVRELVEMVFLMAKAGIQVFIATHSYFVLKQFYICAQREKKEAYCFSLEKNERNYSELSCFNLLEGFPSNAISDTAMDMANEEIELEFGTFKSK
jgi:AAA15 family ATPase/GTPase